MEIDEAVAKHVLGLLLVERLPAIGLQALESGQDTPSLRQLAGAERDSPDEIRRSFIRWVGEAGLRVPTPPEAAVFFATVIAKTVLAGAMTPYEGARQIWGELYVRFPSLQELTPFVGLASDYEGHEEHRDAYSRMIVEQCRRLVQLHRCSWPATMEKTAGHAVKAAKEARKR